MLKKKNVIAILLTATLVWLHAYAVLSGRIAWSELLQLLSSVVSGAVLLYASIKTTRRKAAVIFLLLAVSCFFWTICGIILTVLRLQGKDAGESILVSLTYFVPNVLIAAGLLLAYQARNSKWRSAHSLIESLTIGILCIFFIWIVVFGRGDMAVLFLTRNGVFSAVALLIDIYVGIRFLLLFVSEEKTGLTFSIIIIGSGMYLFELVNLIHQLLTFKNSNLPNGISDLLYAACFILSAFGAFLYTRRGDDNSAFFEQKEPLGKSKWLYMLVFPVISAAAGKVILLDLLIYAIIIVLYHAAIQYIRLAKENEELYKDQFHLNEKLEMRLQEQLCEMTSLANLDTMTKLINRRHFLVCIAQTAGLLKNGEKLAVIQFDVDRFRTINDSYGHDIGDMVIEVLSKRLREWNTFGAVLARLGGDEFAVMMTGNLTREKLGAYSKQIINICSVPIFVGQQVIYITISVGISLCPDDARDVITLIKNSDISMYKAKAEGFNKHVFYSPLFKEHITRKNEIEALLRKADLERDFELVFQPQFLLPGEKLIGAEALIRWRSAEHGYIPPSVFIPVAEEIDYINKIGKWVLLKAVEQVARWNRKYGLNLKMGINISPKQLLEDDFFMTLKTLITSSGINAAWIDAEITENLMIEEKKKVKPIFDLFRELKISVSIDDFGSGYSSLGYLNKYHFDRIKIDKSLIDNLLIPGGSGIEVVKAVVAMASAVGKTTIAEGVETREQLEILRSLGCMQVQGYLLGRPVRADVFAAQFIEKELESSGEERPRLLGTPRPVES